MKRPIFIHISFHDIEMKIFHEMDKKFPKYVRMLTSQNNSEFIFVQLRNTQTSIKNAIES